MSTGTSNQTETLDLETLVELSRYHQFTIEREKEKRARSPELLAKGQKAIAKDASATKVLTDEVQAIEDRAATMNNAYAIYFKANRLLQLIVVCQNDNLAGDDKKKKFLETFGIDLSEKSDADIRGYVEEKIRPFFGVIGTIDGVDNDTIKKTIVDLMLQRTGIQPSSSADKEFHNNVYLIYQHLENILKTSAKQLGFSLAQSETYELIMGCQPTGNFATADRVWGLLDVYKAIKAINGDRAAGGAQPAEAKKGKKKTKLEKVEELFPYLQAQMSPELYSILKSKIRELGERTLTEGQRTNEIVSLVMDTIMVDIAACCNPDVITILAKIGGDTIESLNGMFAVKKADGAKKADDLYQKMLEKINPINLRNALREEIQNYVSRERERWNYERSTKDIVRLMKASGIEVTDGEEKKIYQIIQDLEPREGKLQVSGKPKKDAAAPAADATAAAPAAGATTANKETLKTILEHIYSADIHPAAMFIIAYNKYRGANIKELPFDDFVQVLKDFQIGKGHGCSTNFNTLCEAAEFYSSKQWKAMTAADVARFMELKLKYQRFQSGAGVAPVSDGSNTDATAYALSSAINAKLLLQQREEKGAALKGLVNEAVSGVEAEGATTLDSNITKVFVEMSEHIKEPTYDGSVNDDVKKIIANTSERLVVSARGLAHIFGQQTKSALFEKKVNTGGIAEDKKAGDTGPEATSPIVTVAPDAQKAASSPSATTASGKEAKDTLQNISFDNIAPEQDKKESIRNAGKREEAAGQAKEGKDLLEGLQKALTVKAVVHASKVVEFSLLTAKLYLLTELQKQNEDLERKEEQDRKEEEEQKLKDLTKALEIERKRYNDMLLEMASKTCIMVVKPGEAEGEIVDGVESGSNQGEILSKNRQIIADVIHESIVNILADKEIAEELKRMSSEQNVGKALAEFETRQKEKSGAGRQQE